MVEDVAPDRGARVFDGIEPSSDVDTPVVLNLVSDRLLALAASDAAEDKAAWADLGERRLTVAMVQDVRKQLLEAQLFDASDMIADPTRRAGRDEAVDAAWRFYLRWSVIARAVLRHKPILGMMGIHTRKRALPAPAAAEPPPAAPPADAVGAPNESGAAPAASSSAVK
jgi:hypothetical protein